MVQLVEDTPLDADLKTSVELSPLYRNRIEADYPEWPQLGNPPADCTDVHAYLLRQS
jgi:hypothetical protein